MDKLAMIKQMESSYQNNFGRHPASPLDTCIAWLLQEELDDNLH